MSGDNRSRIEEAARFAERMVGGMTKIDGTQAAFDKDFVPLYRLPYNAAYSQAREVFGDVPACVARELTKMHEEFLRGPLSVLAGELAARKEIKGEITVVLAPQKNTEPQTARSEEGL